MNEKLFVILAFVIVGAFGILFKDAFMATSNFLDETRCSIGWASYCKGSE